MIRINKMIVLVAILASMLLGCNVTTNEVTALYISLWEEQGTKFYTVQEDWSDDNQKIASYELTEENITNMLEKYKDLKELIIRSDPSMLPHRAMRELDQIMYKHRNITLTGKKSGEWQIEELHVISIEKDIDFTLADLLEWNEETISQKSSSIVIQSFFKEEPYLFLYYEGLRDVVEKKLKTLTEYEQQMIQAKITKFASEFNYDKTTIKVWTREKVYNRTLEYKHEAALLKDMFMSARHYEVDNYSSDGTIKYTFSDGTHRLIVYSLGPYGNIAEIPELNVFLHFDDSDYLGRLEAYLFYYDYTEEYVEKHDWKTAASIEDYFEKSSTHEVEPSLYQMNIGAPFTQYDPHTYYDFKNNEYRTRFFLKDTFALETVVYRWDKKVASFNDCLYDETLKEYNEACTTLDKAVIDKHMNNFFADSGYKLDQQTFESEIESFKKKIGL